MSTNIPPCQTHRCTSRAAEPLLNISSTQNSPQMVHEIQKYTVSSAPSSSPLLHALAVIILILAFLGFASTIATLPFRLLPSAKPDYTRSKVTSRSSSTSTNVNVPSAMPNISLNMWMTFFLVMCLVLVGLQGPLGYGISPWERYSKVTLHQRYGS